MLFENTWKMNRINLTNDQRLIIMLWINRALNNPLLQAQIDRIAFNTPAPRLNAYKRMAEDIEPMKGCDALWAYWVITGSDDKQLEAALVNQCPDYQSVEPNELLGEFFSRLESIDVTVFAKG